MKELVRDLFYGDIFTDRERPITQISGHAIVRR